MIKESRLMIVNSNDEIIGFRYRNLLKETDKYRSSSLWIKNSNDEILIAQRSFKKDKYPGIWGPAVSGTNEENETYLFNIIKEAEEEIGLININPIEIKKVISKSKFTHFTTWFYLELNWEITEFKLQKEEVESLRWIKKEKLREELKENSEKYLKSINEDFLFDL